MEDSVQPLNPIDGIGRITYKKKPYVLACRLQSHRTHIRITKQSYKSILSQTDTRYKGYALNNRGLKIQIMAKRETKTKHFLPRDDSTRVLDWIRFLGPM